jgi:hypothetical protein
MGLRFLHQIGPDPRTDVPQVHEVPLGQDRVDLVDDPVPGAGPVGPGQVRTHADHVVGPTRIVRGPRGRVGERTAFAPGTTKVATRPRRYTRTVRLRVVGVIARTSMRVRISGAEPF